MDAIGVDFHKAYSHLTVLNGEGRVRFWRKLYRSLEELQVNLDAWLRE